MIKQVLAQLYKYLVNIVRELSWFREYKHCKKLGNTFSLSKLNYDCRSLILVPHADDEWIGCSSIIRHSSQVLLFNMDMPGGDSIILHKHRFGELSRLASKYNVELVTPEVTKEKTLVNTIIKYKPTHLYLPFFFDWHDEHIMTMRILQKIISDNKDLDFKIGMYQVSLPILPEICTHYCAMTREDYILKWRVFRNYYKSQLDIPFKRFAINEKINGNYVREYASEFFCITSSKEWMMNVDEWILSEREKEQIKQNLLSISTTRSLLKEFYKNRTWKSLK